MLIHVDKALTNKISGLSLNNISIEPINKDKHNLLREEEKYPCITWVRLDKQFDLERYINGYQEVVSDIMVDRYALPEPYNVMYQIEIISKERYSFDMMEMFIDSCIKPRGDMLPIDCVIESELITKTIKFPLKINEVRQLDDYADPSNVYYRRIYTISVKVLIDLDVLISSDYKILGEADIQEL